MKALICKKLGKTRNFAQHGGDVPDTRIRPGAGAWAVVQVRATDVQLGFGARKATRTPKALLGHVKRAGLEGAHRVLRSFPTTGELPKPGESITVAIFAPGDRVKVTGISKGRGFQGV